MTAGRSGSSASRVNVRVSPAIRSRVAMTTVTPSMIGPSPNLVDVNISRAPAGSVRRPLPLYLLSAVVTDHAEHDDNSGHRIGALVGAGPVVAHPRHRAVPLAVDTQRCVQGRDLRRRGRCGRRAVAARHPCVRVLGGAHRLSFPLVAVNSGMRATVANLSLWGVETSGAAAGWRFRLHIPTPATAWTGTPWPPAVTGPAAGRRAAVPSSSSAAGPAAGTRPRRRAGPPGAAGAPWAVLGRLPRLRP